MRSPPRILVTGAGGMVGVAVQRASGLTDMEIVALSRRDLDVTVSHDVDRVLRDLRPSVVLHLAAYAAVDRAESHPEEAAAVNRDGTANVANSARAIDARVVFVSTDYVFDGHARTPYHPSAAINPINVYGRTKWLGEEAIRSTVANHAIVRTSWVFAPWGNNFVRTVVNRAAEASEMRIVADQIGRPTAAQDLAAALLEIAATPDLTGTFHFANAGEASWHDVAVSVVSLLRQRGSPVRLRISPIPTSEYPTAASRPVYSVLDTTTFTAATGIVPRSWREALSDTLDCLQ